MRDGIGRERKRKGRRVDSKLKRVPEFIGSAALREKFDCTVPLASAFAVLMDLFPMAKTAL